MAGYTLDGIAAVDSERETRASAGRRLYILVIRGVISILHISEAETRVYHVPSATLSPGDMFWQSSNAIDLWR
jgi:hypothetical protein